ncbi:MAG: DNA-binding GntR family transcriptional regulator, partial [Cellvibrionaceae bacterium]
LIRQKIVSLELAPGNVIDENSLREQLELGRTPIREALQRLALEQLVTIIPRRGMFVTEIRLTDLQRLFEVRVPLEAQAALLAARRGTRQHWDDMQAVLDNIPSGVYNGHPENETLMQHDQACHQIMYAAADNSFLTDTLTNLYTLSLRLWYFTLQDMEDVEGAVAQHQAILNALRDGKDNEAADLVEKHIRHFQEEIQAVMLK